MSTLRITSLFHGPSQTYVEAELVSLTAAVIETEIDQKWWHDNRLKTEFSPCPIDRDWDWHESIIEYDEMRLASEKIGIFAGGDLQGALMISTEPVPSQLEPGKHALFVERLFTAPRNRRNLRLDNSDFLKGVGFELLTYGAWMSRNMGHGGRLILDGSPDFVWWYEQKCHLQKLPLKPMVFEGVVYAPMELPVAGADRLLKLWEDA